jgi:hypothetical protein
LDFFDALPTPAAIAIFAHDTVLPEAGDCDRGAVEQSSLSSPWVAVSIDDRSG